MNNSLFYKYLSLSACLIPFHQNNLSPLPFLPQQVCHLFASVCHMLYFTPYINSLVKVGTKNKVELREMLWYVNHT